MRQRRRAHGSIRYRSPPGCLRVVHIKLSLSVPPGSLDPPESGTRGSHATRSAGSASRKNPLETFPGSPAVTENLMRSFTGSPAAGPAKLRKGNQNRSTVACSRALLLRSSDLRRTERYIGRRSLLTCIPAAPHTHPAQKWWHRPWPFPRRCRCPDQEAQCIPPASRCSRTTRLLWS
jgi:hypothetical protein